MTQLRQDEDVLEQHGVRVVVVSFDADWMAEAYVEQTALQWPLLIDESQQTYRRYGMSRGSAWAIYGPQSIWNYLKLIVGRGRRVQKPGADYRQLGGDVLVDPEGVIRFYFSSDSPHDRPDLNQILRPLRDVRLSQP